MLEALIFDVDGTVAETEALHLRAFNLAFARHDLGITWDGAEYRRLLRVPGGKERIACSLSQRRLARSAAEVAEVHATKGRFYEMLAASEGVRWRPGVRRLMDEAQGAGLRLGLATTTSERNLDPLFAPELGAAWRSRFAAILAGDAVPCKKPAPDAYVWALARMNVPARRAVAFEDSAAGVAAARAAGLAVVATPSAWLPHDDLSRADLLLAHGLEGLSIHELASWHRGREAACFQRA